MHLDADEKITTFLGSNTTLESKISVAHYCVAVGSGQPRAALDVAQDVLRLEHVEDGQGGRTRHGVPRKTGAPSEHKTGFALEGGDGMQ